MMTSDWDNYRILQKGEIISSMDEVDSIPDGWWGEPKWVSVAEHCSERIGQPAPDPSYPAHAIYRREL